MLSSGEAEIRQKYGVSLRKVSAFQYAVFRDGLLIGSLCRLFPEGWWYFTNREIRLPFAGRTRYDALLSYLKSDELKGGDW